MARQPAPQDTSLKRVQQAPQEASAALQAVLGLIQHSRQLSDLTIEHVGRHMGQPLQQADGDNTRHGFGVQLDDNWNYGVLLDSRQQPRFELSFNNSTDDSSIGDSASMQTLCQLDYAVFTARLEAEGLQRASSMAGTASCSAKSSASPGCRSASTRRGSRPAMRNSCACAWCPSPDQRLCPLAARNASGIWTR